MKRVAPAIVALSLIGCAVAASLPRLASDPEIDAATIAPLNGYATSGGWNTPHPPFKVIGNIYYVGTANVSSYLIATPAGHVVIDGVLAQTTPQIVANIKALGFDIRDVKYLLNTHAHIDHAGGLAGLQRASGAAMVASAGDRPALERGDIGYGPSAGMRFPPIRVDRVVGEGDTLVLGDTTLTAHITPGHTPGCTSWSMPVRGADGASHTAFFHCSSSVGGQSLAPEAYPGMVEAYRTTFERVRQVKADVFLPNHENFFDLDVRYRRLKAGDANAFVDPGALQAFNSEMEASFEETLAKQQKARK